MSGDDRIAQSIANFSAAVAKLKEFVSKPIEDDRDRAGIIQAFEFTYELAWKTLKKIAESKGLEAPTPVQAFQAAFQMDFIKENEQTLWLAMKNTRNLTSHTYKEELALEVLEQIKNNYVDAFEIILKRIKSTTN